MSKGFEKIAIGAAIIGAAFLTGGASLVPSISPRNWCNGWWLHRDDGAGQPCPCCGCGCNPIWRCPGARRWTKAAMSLSTLDRLQASLNPSAPRTMVFGETALATDIRYVEPSGTNQEYIDYVLVVPSHTVSFLPADWGAAS